MQLEKERLLSLDQHRRFVEAAARDRLARTARWRPNVATRGTMVVYLIGLLFTL